ncbi:toxin VasX [Psychrobacter sp. DAB_AL43B]|uniref:toxin VasX n=1 Tax=Psychrobacter sp. DAB_AL43B TaxID=1028416 RepID=UPI0009A86E84|nr:toxin VasX [Psychrobacter sp. DAB_AL43B]SLJ84299.1 hypothetical protein DABAL43B_1101 [Psychrobacter sp. DAB_AL43B]
MSKDISEIMKDMTNDHKKDLTRQKQAEIEQARKDRERERHNTVQIKDEDIPVSLIRYCDYDCEKFGIPILPVFFSRLDYKLSSKDERFFDHPLTNKSSKHDAITSMPNRTYLYVYVENTNSWIEYYCGKDGAFSILNIYERYALETTERKTDGDRYIYQEEHADPDSEQPFNCSKSAHSTLATKYITVNVGDINWLMISHTKLSKGALKRYSDDKQRRSKRMQSFVGRSLTNNVNTVEMTNREIGYIESFYRRKELSKESGSLDSKTNMQEKSSDAVHTYSQEDHSKTVAAVSYTDSYEVKGQSQIANKLFEHMNNIAILNKRILPESKPMMVALPDPVGEVIAAAEKRNYLLSQLSEISEDKDHSRKVINALIIKNLEKSSIKTTQFEDKKVFNWGDSDYVGTLLNIGFSDTDPDDLIYPHINISSYKSYLKASQKIIDLKNKIVSARQVFVKAITSEEFKFVLESDFDIELLHDEETAKGFEAIVAGCTAGCGIDDSNLGIPQSILDAFETAAPKSNVAADEEFKAALLPQLSAGIDINQNWLLKALGGLDKELVEILYNFSKQDRASEATGAGIGYISEKISVTWLNKITVDNKRSALENKDKLIKTLSQNLLKLSFYDPKAFRALYKTLELSIYGHSGVVVVPIKITATADTMAAFANFALGAVFPKSVVSKINAKANKARQGITNVVEAATDTTIVRTPKINSPQQSETFVAYYFDEAYSTGKGMDSLNQLNDGQRSINLDKLDAKALAAEAIKWHNNVQKVANGGIGVVSGFIAYFQLNAVIASMPAIARLKYAGNPLRLTEVQLGTISSGLALVTASMDVTASGAGVLGKTGFANRLVYRAGWIGIIGATFEVGSLAIYGYRKFNDGNVTSSALTVGSAFSIGASAYAGLNLGLLAIASPTALPALPLLAIMFVGMTLSYVFQRLAFKFDDKNNTLIEYWLDNSVFGHKAMRGQDYYLINPFQTQSAFISLEQDISGFITACTLFLANNRLQTFQGRMPVEHKANSNSEIRLPPVFESVREHLTLFESKILIGNWDKASQLTIEVVADKNGSEQSLYKATFYNSATGKPSASNITSLAIEELMPIVTQKESEHQFFIDTQLLKFEPHNINKAKVIVTYTPDTSRNPPYPLKDVSYLDNNSY